MGTGQTVTDRPDTRLVTVTQGVGNKVTVRFYILYTLQPEIKCSSTGWELHRPGEPLPQLSSSFDHSRYPATFGTTFSKVCHPPNGPSTKKYGRAP